MKQTLKSPVKYMNPAIRLPAELTKGECFVCWKLEPAKDGKEAKIPYDVKTGKRAKTNDPATWAGFETCHRAYRLGKYSGVSRVLTKDDPHFVIDLDDCFGDDAYMVTKQASEIVDSFDTYTEVSPGGKGLHVWGKGEKPGPRCRTDGIEVYDDKRFITLTGQQHHGEKVKDCQPQLDNLYEERLAKKEEEGDHIDPDDFVAIKTLSNEQVIKRIKEKKFELWDGDHSTYASQSEADLALIGEIAYWTGPDPDRIDAVFRESGLCREKWEKRADYRREAIKKAIKGTKWFYGENLLNRVILPVEDFSALKVEPKRMILSPWLTENSVTMIAGLPGIGKSMLVQSLLISITHGQDFGPFKVGTPVPCLFLDGEMPTQTAQERLSLLSPGGKPKQPLYIYSDAYSSMLEGIPPANLLEEKWRDQMAQMLMELGVKVFAIDNLVSLSPGIDEDRKVDYDPINQWLKQLRYKGIAVILVHHTGKSGDQRGTSAREDNADTVILLKRPQGYCSHHGVRFKMNMRKARNMRPQELRFIRDTLFQLEEVTKDKSAWKFDSTKEDLIKEVVKLVAAGMRNVDIAKDLDIDPSYVGTLKSRSIVKWGWLTGDGKLTDAGRRYCELEEEEDDL